MIEINELLDGIYEQRALTIQELTYEQSHEYAQLEIVHHPVYENGFVMEYHDDHRSFHEKSKSAQECDAFALRVMGSKLFTGYGRKFILDRKYIDENIQINHRGVASVMYNGGTLTEEEKVYLRLRWQWKYK